MTGRLWIGPRVKYGKRKIRSDIDLYCCEHQGARLFIIVQNQLYKLLARLYGSFQSSRAKGCTYSIHFLATPQWTSL